MGSEPIILLFCCRYYCDWTREVERATNNNMLEFDVSTGWEPLCQYLECPTPATNFPR